MVTGGGVGDSAGLPRMPTGHEAPPGGGPPPPATAALTGGKGEVSTMRGVLDRLREDVRRYHT